MEVLNIGGAKVEFAQYSSLSADKICLSAPPLVLKCEKTFFYLLVMLALLTIRSCKKKEIAVFVDIP